MFFSEAFTADTGAARKHYDSVRSALVAARRRKTGDDRPVRVASNAIVLQSLSGDRWVNHCRGLSDGVEKVRQYGSAGASTCFRWSIPVAV